MPKEKLVLRHVLTKGSRVGCPRSPTGVSGRKGDRVPPMNLLETVPFAFWCLQSLCRCWEDRTSPVPQEKTFSSLSCITELLGSGGQERNFCIDANPELS